MAELKDRLTDEEKLLAILLLIFASEPLPFWLSADPSPYWFLEKIQATRIRRIVDSVSLRAAQGMLKEIQVDIGDLNEAIAEANEETPPSPPAPMTPIDLPGDDAPVADPRTRPQPVNRVRDGLLDRLRTVGQAYELELATRLHRVFREWQADIAAKQEAAEPVDPVIYPEHRAESEAITQVTGFISQAELITAAFVRGFLHVQVAAKWETAEDDRVCLRCGPLNGTFQSVWMQQAPQGPPIHVRCVLGETPVSVTGVVACVKTHYQGPIVWVDCGEWGRFGVSPNHMLLSRHGFIRASDIVKGDDIIRTSLVEANGFPNLHCPDDNRKPALAHEIFDAFAVTSGVRSCRVPVAPENLHGDAAFSDGYVDVVYADGLLRHEIYSRFGQPCPHLPLVGRHNFATSLPCSSKLHSLLSGLADATDGGMGLLRERKSLLFGSVRHANVHSFTSATDGQPEFFQPLVDCHSRDTESLAHFKDANPSVIEFAKVIRVDVDTPSHGVDLYDFETLESLYLIGNGIISSNCRCYLQFYRLTDNR